MDKQKDASRFAQHNILIQKALLAGADIDSLLSNNITESEIIQAVNAITKQNYTTIVECYMADLYKARLLYIYKEALKKKRFDVALKALKEYNTDNVNKEVNIEF